MLVPLVFCCLLLPSHASLVTSCSGRDSDWSRRGVAAALRSWLRSGVTEVGEGGGAGSSEGGVWSWLWDPLTGTVHPHYAGYKDGVEEGEDGEELTNRRVVTVAREAGGLAWQWRGRSEAEGWLYGVLDGRGGLEGQQVTFIYPDLRTGLQGRWEGGLLRGAQGVTVVAERCSGGVKELLLEPVGEGEVDHLDPRTMDPHERGAVYVGRSEIAGGGEGLFARRLFLPGDLISYFGGLVTFPENFLFDNMTAVEEEDAGSYFFNLEQFSPAWWGVPEGQVIDTPGPMRSIVHYRTTLGHKCNNAWGEARTAEFDTVRHPVLGPVACLLARAVIQPGQEVSVNYGYALDTAPDWYVREHRAFRRARKAKLG